QRFPSSAAAQSAVVRQGSACTQPPRVGLHSSPIAQLVSLGRLSQPIATSLQISSVQAWASAWHAKGVPATQPLPGPALLGSQVSPPLQKRPSSQAASLATKRQPIEASSQASLVQLRPSLQMTAFPA